MTKPRDPTQFTRESAERIANVVRAAELGAAPARPLNFERVDFSKSRVFRVCTYTGAWSIGSEKTVTFKYKTDTPNTASVTNLFFPVTSTAAGSRDCAIAKDGTAWFLVDVRFGTATAVFVTGTQTRQFIGSVSTQTLNLVTAVETSQSSVVTDVTVAASLNTSSCSITVNRTLTTASRTFVSSVSTASQNVVVSSVTATAIFVQSTATGTYLKVEV